MLRQLACTKNLGATGIHLYHLRTRLKDVHMTCQYTFYNIVNTLIKISALCHLKTTPFLKLNAIGSKLEFLFISLLNETSEEQFYFPGREGKRVRESWKDVTEEKLRSMATWL